MILHKANSGQVISKPLCCCTCSHVVQHGYSWLPDDDREHRFMTLKQEVSCKEGGFIKNSKNVIQPYVFLIKKSERNFSMQLSMTFTFRAFGAFIQSNLQEVHLSKERQQYTIASGT